MPRLSIPLCQCIAILDIQICNVTKQKNQVKSFQGQARLVLATIAESHPVNQQCHACQYRCANDRLSFVRSSCNLHFYHSPISFCLFPLSVFLFTFSYFLLPFPFPFSLFLFPFYIFIILLFPFAFPQLFGPFDDKLDGGRK